MITFFGVKAQVFSHCLEKIWFILLFKKFFSFSFATSHSCSFCSQHCNAALNLPRPLLLTLHLFSGREAAVFWVIILLNIYSFEFLFLLLCCSLLLVDACGFCPANELVQNANQTNMSVSRHLWKKQVYVQL